MNKFYFVGKGAAEEEYRGAIEAITEDQATTQIAGLGLVVEKIAPWREYMAARSTAGVYRWRVLTSERERLTGELEAANQAEAEERLRALGVSILTIAEAVAGKQVEEEESPTVVIDQEHNKRLKVVLKQDLRIFTAVLLGVYAIYYYLLRLPTYISGTPTINSGLLMYVIALIFIGYAYLWIPHLLALIRKGEGDGYSVSLLLWMNIAGAIKVITLILLTIPAILIVYESVAFLSDLMDIVIIGILMAKIGSKLYLHIRKKGRL